MRKRCHLNCVSRFAIKAIVRSHVSEWLDRLGVPETVVAICSIPSSFVNYAGEPHALLLPTFCVPRYDCVAVAAQQAKPTCWVEPVVSEVPIIHRCTRARIWLIEQNVFYTAQHRVCERPLASHAGRWPLTVDFAQLYWEWPVLE